MRGKGVTFPFLTKDNRINVEEVERQRREGKDLKRRKNNLHDGKVAVQLLCAGEFIETRLPLCNRIITLHS